MPQIFGGAVISNSGQIGDGVIVNADISASANIDRSKINSAAASGANSDITSLSGLTTPLSVAQGGTGKTSVTAARIPVGNGTGALNEISEGTAGQVLKSNGAGNAPTFQDNTGSVRELTVYPMGKGNTVAYPQTTILGDWQCVPIGAGSATQYLFFVFHVPSDFASLTECKLMIIPDTTETVQYQVSVSKSAVGQAYNADTDVTSGNESRAVTLDTLAELDLNVQSVFSTVAAGDWVGVQVDSRTSVIRAVALRFKYAI